MNATVPVYALVVLPKASLAMTVKLPAVPAVVGDEKPATASTLAAAALTVMPVWLPVMLPVVAVTVRDRLPAVFSVALKTCTPLSPLRPVVNV